MIKNKKDLWKILRFLGPGFLITIGFVDPGNWATNIDGGSKFGYELLWVITLSTMILIIVQNMSAKVGIATGKSLAANIKNNFPKIYSIIIGTTIIIACVATDVAEILGAAIGFNLLFRIPIWIGALITIFLEIFFIVSQRYHRLERILIIFLGIISLCYVIEIFIVKPAWNVLLPSVIIPKINKTSIYIAMGILGAIVMPHNIFLHSNVIHSRKWGINESEKIKTLKYEKIDTFVAMFVGWLINSSMIVVAAAIFFKNNILVDSIQQASETLTPLAGQLAGLLFAIALVFSGVGSSITSSLAEVNVITGFLGKPEDPRTLLYKISIFLTAIPSFFIIIFGFDVYKILIFSQVVLSIQLPFTLIPLLILCRNKKIMGNFYSKSTEFILAIIISTLVIILNLFLLYTNIFPGA